MVNFGFSKLFKPAIMAGAALSLGGCMYGLGTDGYYGDGYVNGAGNGCDPYAPFDDYYACDNRFGFVNIGFGGGWYDNYYYPGYGYYLFDRGGHRHVMRNHHRRHWARQRAYYGTRHGGRRGHHGRRLTHQQREKWHNATPEERAAIREQRRNGHGLRAGGRHTDGAHQGRGHRGSGHGVRNRGVRGETVRSNSGRRNAGSRAVRGRTVEQARATRDRGQARDRGSVSRHPAAQARPNPARAAHAPVARPAPRVSPRTPRVDRSNVNDD